MSLKKRAKRWTYLVHRWTGIFGCLLMALWFVSGVVMLYVGLPKLTPWERLAALPALPLSLERPPDVQGDGLVLTSIAGKPNWRRGSQVFSAEDGQAQAAVTPQQALAEVRVYAPKAALHYAGLVTEDRWTHSRALDAHRPLYLIKAEGEAAGSYYVSSKTGQLLLDAPLYQQRWNYIGAWLHWLYLFRSQSADPFWTGLVIVLSAVCTVTALSGIVVGLWRMRFRRRYRNGAHTPYREFWMRWHHLLGLAFSLFVFSWIFSGLMSMNPVDALLPAYPPPDSKALQGKASEPPAALMQPEHIISALQQSGFTPVELHFKRLKGEHYVLAFNNQAQTRLVRADAKGALHISERWTAEEILPAAKRLFAAPLVESRVVTAYERYYYQRHPEAMMGAMPYRLPALRLEFADSGKTLVYIDLQTGEVAQSADKIQRLRRWWFFFLHSWDTPALLQAGVWRDLVIILLSAGGFFVSVSGAVIGWRRLRDVYVRGKYRDVILPMTVLRRLDAVLEASKQVVLLKKQFLDEQGIKTQDSALRAAAGQACCGFMFPNHPSTAISQEIGTCLLPHPAHAAASLPNKKCTRSAWCASNTCQSTRFAKI